MGLKDEFDMAKNHVANIQWDQVMDEVQVFETVIRYVGGLISAYELSLEKIFIKKCVELVDLLLPAFDTPTNIPHQYIVLKTGKVFSSTSSSSGSELTNIAEAATCQLEFTRLSQITGDWKYHFTGQRVYKAFKKMKTPYKGLFPHLIDINTGQARSDYYSWGGMADSFYEYLIKQYVLTKDEEKKEMAIQAIHGMKTFLLQQPQGDAFQKLKFIGTINEDQHYPAMGELACFAPGSILLAAREIPELRNHSGDGQLEEDARALLLGCYQAWISTRSGIAPEGFAWIPERGTSLDNLTVRQKELAKIFGVFPYGASDYILRPETLESIFYFYQYNNDSIYQDMAWTLFKNINQYCKANSGYSGINNVDSTSPRWNDRQESFLFAETFKYLYIIWDEEPRFPFDQWVFNTEAHPFRITDIHPPSTITFIQSSLAQ
ncbi:glycoside hydrolase [Cunninghamella echinulata]|nr:glycoside hydrolase [Cunninghamella echinulata]